MEFILVVENSGVHGVKKKGITELKNQNMVFGLLATETCDAIEFQRLFP